GPGWLAAGHAEAFCPSPLLDDVGITSGDAHAVAGAELLSVHRQHSQTAASILECGLDSRGLVVELTHWITPFNWGRWPSGKRPSQLKRQQRSGTISAVVAFSRRSTSSIPSGVASRSRASLILDPTSQSQFLKEQRLAFAPWHFSLLREAINLVPVSLEPFDRRSIEHVESRRRRYSSDPVVELRRFAGVLSARPIKTERKVLSGDELRSATPRAHNTILISFPKANQPHSDPPSPNSHTTPVPA